MMANNGVLYYPALFLSLLAVSFTLKPPSVFLYQQRDDYVLVDYKNVSIPYSNFTYKGLVPTTNRSYVAYVAVLPFNIPDMFSIELPQNGNNKAFYYYLRHKSMIV